MTNTSLGENAMAKHYVLVVGSKATRIETQGGGWGPTGNGPVTPFLRLVLHPVHRDRARSDRQDSPYEVSLIR
jgi:hypothetical protein